MTDPPADPGPDVDPDLEIASALHDGAATVDERARAQDPAVRVAHARIAAVAARVADVPPPPAGLLDAHVAAALDAEAGAEAGAGADGAGSVAALADRRPWWQRAPLGAVAAAIAVVALVGAISVAAGGDDGSEDTATAALESVEEASGGDAAGPPEADMGGDTALRASEPEAFATYEELAAAIASRLTTAAPTSGAAEESAPTGADVAPTAEAEAGSPPPPTAAAGACDPVAAAGLDPVTVQMVTSVVVRGQPIVAVVHDHGGDPVLTSVDEASCAVTDRRPLPRS